MFLESPSGEVLGDVITAELTQITRIHFTVGGSSHATKPDLDDCFLTHPVLHCIAIVAAHIAMCSSKINVCNSSHRKESSIFLISLWGGTKGLVVLQKFCL